MGTKGSNLGEMETKLKVLATKIDELETKVRKKHPQDKAHVEQVETLYAKHMTAHQMLQQLEKETHEELKTLKSGWEEIVEDMQQVLDKLASSY